MQLASPRPHPCSTSPVLLSGAAASALRNRADEGISDKSEEERSRPTGPGSKDRRAFGKARSPGANPTAQRASEVTAAADGSDDLVQAASGYALAHAHGMGKLRVLNLEP